MKHERDELPAVGAYIPDRNGARVPFGNGGAPLFGGRVAPLVMERPTVSQWGPIIRARYETPRPYTSWCILLSVPFTGGRGWFDLRFKKFDK